MLEVNNIKKRFKKKINKKKTISFYADNNISFKIDLGVMICE